MQMNTFYRRSVLIWILALASLAFGQEVDKQKTEPVQDADRVTAGGIHAPLTNRPLQSHRLGSGVIRRDSSAVALLGSVITASPAESFALNGNLAYVCDDNEISVIDVGDPANPRILATSTAGNFINASALTYCNIERGQLVVLSDQASSNIGNSPGFVTFSLANPLQPSLVKATALNKRFFNQVAFVGSYAFISTNALSAFAGGWDGQYGDLISVDVSNFNTPALAGTLEQPQLDSRFGGATMVAGVTSVAPDLLYVGGSTSTGNQNNGVGRLQVVDVSNPTSMQVVGQLLLPGMKQFYGILAQGNRAVGIGNTGGYTGAIPVALTGNIVVATFDITDPRQPKVLSMVTTPYLAGAGGGSAVIGTNLFAFAGAWSSSTNPVVLTVDVTNPSAPDVQAIPSPKALSSMQVVGRTMYATLGLAGFAIYSVPGVSSSSTACPAFVDAMLLFDQGAVIPPQAFSDAKISLKSFISSLQLLADRVGVESFTSTATIGQTLTHNGSSADAAVDAISQSSGSNIGAAIVAAQAELTGPHQNLQATPTIVIVSDGVDSSAPSGATIAAANAAKAAGIRIISIQYGSNANGLMQAIASSVSDYHAVGQ
jgi:hypothetical protein